MEQNAAEELEFIKKIIEDSRRDIFVGGLDYIFWGVLVVIGMISNYFVYTHNIPVDYFWVWLVIIFIGWTYSIYYHILRTKKIKALNFASKITGAVWLSCGIAMSLCGFVGTEAHAIKGMSVSPILCCILGCGYFITGVVVRYNWIRNLSFGWWIGAIIMFFYTGSLSNFIMAVLMIFFQIIPGVIIHNKSKKQYQNEK